MVLLDADDDCPATLGAEIVRRSQQIVPHRRVSVVLANREFEAWFIAAAESLHEQRGFCFDPAETIEAETPRDAKKWMSKRMASAYRETLDQPAFSACFDLLQAFDGSRSFRKLCQEWRRQVAG